MVNELDRAAGRVGYVSELPSYGVDGRIVVFRNAVAFNERVDRQRVNVVLSNGSGQRLDRRHGNLQIASLRERDLDRLLSARIEEQPSRNLLRPDPVVLASGKDTPLHFPQRIFAIPQPYL